MRAIAPEADLVDERGARAPVWTARGAYPLDLPGAACSGGAPCFIGGPPRLLVEAGGARRTIGRWVRLPNQLRPQTLRQPCCQRVQP